jgi:tetratricopeptide (TPR) repeat protein
MFDNLLNLLRGDGTTDAPALEGQLVVFARPDVVLRATPEDGAAALGPGDGVFRVEGERDGWLWLTTAGVEGWARREGVVPLAEASDHFAAELGKDRDGQFERFAVQQIGHIRRAVHARTLAALDQLAGCDLPPELAAVVAELRSQADGGGECDKLVQSLQHFYAGLDVGGDDPAAAERAYTEALALEPSAEAYNNRSLARHTLGDYAGAAADFTESLRLEPDSHVVYCNRGRTHKFAGDHDRARADYDAAIRLNRDYPPAYYNRALLHVARKDYGAALADYRRAVRIDPEYSTAFNNLAWIRATCPDPAYRDGRRAVKAARRACRFSGGLEAGFLDTLAAAYAEAGDFERAVKWQRRVVARRDAAGEAERAADARARLALYEQGRPYRTGG